VNYPAGVFLTWPWGSISSRSNFSLPQHATLTIHLSYVLFANKQVNTFFFPCKSSEARGIECCSVHSCEFPQVMFEDENLYIDTSFAEKKHVPHMGVSLLTSTHNVVTDENFSMFTHINEL